MKQYGSDTGEGRELRSLKHFIKVKESRAVLDSSVLLVVPGPEHTGCSTSSRKDMVFIYILSLFDSGTAVSTRKRWVRVSSLMGLLQKFKLRSGNEAP